VSARNSRGIAKHGSLCVGRAALAGRVLMIGPLLWTTLLASGCIFDALGPPEDDPTITGVITRVYGENTPTMILIEEDADIADPDFVPEMMLLQISGTSIWVQQTDASWQPGDLDDLLAGRTARVWAYVSGIDPYPARGVAKDIAILYR
jgi:hypothetical protein